jgi:hypothetical protein
MILIENYKQIKYKTKNASPKIQILKYKQIKYNS